jgi:hypothetical protein
MADVRKMDIGFQGGQVLDVRVAAEEHQELRKALEKGGGWYELRTQDSEVALDLAQVVYVRLDTAEHGVGF